MAPLNLDDIQRADAPEPFKFTLGGESYTCRDMQEVDYRKLLDGLRAAQRGDTDPLMHCIIHDEDHERFFANEIPTYRVKALLDGYKAQYGIDVGEASASPSS